MEAENFCKSALMKQRYSDIRFSDVVRAMSYVAMKRDGYNHLQTRFDAFAFCQQMGVLHIEPLAGPDQSKIKYVFPSPVHQRYTIIVSERMVMLNGMLELHIGASGQVPALMQRSMALTSSRYASMPSKG